MATRLQWLQHSCHEKRNNFVLPGFASRRHTVTQAPVGNPFLLGNHDFPQFHALSRTKVRISRCLKCTLSGLFAVKMLLRKVSWPVLLCFKVLCFWSRNGWFHPVQAEARWWPGRSIGKLSWVHLIIVASLWDAGADILKNWSRLNLEVKRG